MAKRSRIVPESGAEVSLSSTTYKSSQKYLIIGLLFRVILDLVDILLSYINLSFFLASSAAVQDENNIYRKLLLFSTILGSIIGVYACLSHVRIVNGALEVNRKGIKVEKSSLRSKKRLLRKSRITSSMNLYKQTIQKEAELPFEANLVFTRQKITYLKTALLLGFFQDLPLLILITYRIFFSTILFNAEISICITENTTFFHCEAAKEINAAVIQLLFCMGSLTFKLTYYRDLTKERNKLKAIMNMLKDSSERDSSILDEFVGVKESEIAKINIIRNMLSDSIKHELPGVYTDVKALRFLRKCDNDELEAATRIRAWLKFRKENGADEIRKEILNKDLAFEDLRTCFRKVLCNTMEVCDSCMAIYTYLGDPSQLTKIANQTNSDPQRDAIIDNEFREIIMENYDSKTKQVTRQLSFTYVDPKATLRSLMKFQGFTSTRVEVDQLYPGNQDIQVFITRFPGKFSYMLKLITELMPYANARVISESRNGYLILSQNVPQNLIPWTYLPKESKENVSNDGSSNILHSRFDPQLASQFTKNDIWGLRDDRVQMKRISEHIGHYLTISTFSGVTYLEVQAVREVKELFHKHLHETRIDPDTLPVDFIGDVNLLRFFRKNNNNIENTLDHLIATLEMRTKNGLNEINAKIRQGNIRLNDIPGWKEYVLCMGCPHFAGREKSSGCLIGLECILRYIDANLAKRFWPSELFLTVCFYLKEYTSILLDELSRAESQLVQIRYVSDYRQMKFKEISKLALSARSINAKVFEVAEDKKMVAEDGKEIIWGVNSNIAQIFSLLQKISPVNFGTHTLLIPETPSGLETWREHFPFQVPESIFHMDRKEIIAKEMPPLETLLKKLQNFELL